MRHSDTTRTEKPLRSRARSAVINARDVIFDYRLQTPAANVSFLPDKYMVTDRSP